MIRKLLLANAVLALLIGPAAAQQFGNPPGPGPVPPSTGAQPAPPAGGKGAQTTGAAPASMAAADFVRKAAISDMFEIQSSQLAREKADQDGRSFAVTMIQAHTETTGELRSLVKDGKVRAELPPGLDDAHKQKLERLRALSGDAFVEAYETMQVQAHRDAVELFTAYAQNGDNATLKQWAEKTLPKLKQHLDMAEKLK